MFHPATDRLETMNEQGAEVSLIGRAPVKARVRSAPAVKFGHAVVGPEIHLLVFHAAPQPLDEDVVSPFTFAVHADRDAVLDQQAGNAAPVNCEPWSVLKIFGLPCLASASSNVSTQKAAGHQRGAGAQVIRMKASRPTLPAASAQHRQRYPSRKSSS